MIMTEEISQYLKKLSECERSENTIKKYQRDLYKFMRFAGGKDLSKEMVIGYKKMLSESYSALSVNSMIAPLNGIFSYLGINELKVKPLSIQQNTIRDDKRSLTKAEYERLVLSAEQKNPRLALIIQSICSTGIRISELKYITVEAAERGFTDISNKGKIRRIFLPNKLCELLKQYAKNQNKESGAVFTTRSGKAVDRSNVWHLMKSLCSEANVNSQKVYPHNLRHLFAREHYSQFHDLSRLCDILGHSNISTTRIYIADTGSEHIRQLDSLDLVLNSR